MPLCEHPNVRKTVLMNGKELTYCPECGGTQHADGYWYFRDWIRKGNQFHRRGE
jgi:hypothetical protein